jgi:antitoxin ParD1/3/4
MTIHLSGDREQFVCSLIQAGRYASEDEVIDDALRLLQKAVEHAMKVREKRNDALLLEGLDSGEAIPVTKEYWEEKKRTLTERLGKAIGQ